jgi:hypothetical protein
MWVLFTPIGVGFRLFILLRFDFGYHVYDDQLGKVLSFSPLSLVLTKKSLSSPTQLPFLPWFPALALSMLALLLVGPG